MENKGKIWSIPFIMGSLVSGLSFLGLFIVEPVTSRFLIDTMHIDVLTAGTIVGILPLVALLFRPVSSVISNRFGIKYLLAISMGFMTIGLFGYTLFSGATWFIICRCLIAVGISISTTLGAAYVATMIPAERINEGMGYYGLIISLFSAFAPTIGVMLVDEFGFINTSYIAAFITFICIVIAIAIPRKEEFIIKNAKKIEFSIDNFISIKVIPIAIFSALISIGNGVVSAYILIVGAQRQIPGIVSFFTIIAIVGFAVRPLVGRMADKGKSHLIIIFGTIIDSIGVAIIGLASKNKHIMQASFFKGIGQNSAGPTLQVEAMKKLPVEQGTVASSTYFIGVDLGAALGPMVSGALISRLGTSSESYRTLFLLTALLLAGTAIAYIIYYRYSKKNGD